MSGEWRVGTAIGLVVLGGAVVVWAAFAVATDLIGAATWADAETVRWWLLLAVVAGVIAGLSARTLHRADEWLDAIPAKSFLPSVAWFAAMALGALVAALTVSDLVLRIVAAAVAVTATVFSVLRARMLRDEIVSARAEYARVDALRAHGRRVRAQVIDAEFTQVWVGAMMLFEVTAEYTTRSGTHQVGERLLTGIDDAPVVGGTVLLWVAADGSAPTDVFMEPDPESIRHPDPSQFLPVSEPRMPGGEAIG
ncbi:hypothetical protein [Microbacterium sp. NPDC056234]|uniref:hypothetical protein n=1 Tax=Microbacterium sp. NPDC056234 TaxID=3345757 RepID=UPI0035D953C1